MYQINEVYRLNYMKNYFSYVGTLRNQKKFNLNDNVFFVINGNEIARGEIVGVELPPVDNPDYTYKIKLPEDLIREKMESDDFYKGEGFDKVSLNCDRIFSTIDEAKESAKKNLEHMYELQSKEIERYFSQFSGSEQTAP